MQTATEKSDSDFDVRPRLFTLEKSNMTSRSPKSGSQITCNVPYGIAPFGIIMSEQNTTRK